MSGKITFTSGHPITKIQSEGGHRYIRWGSENHLPITLVRTMTSTTTASKISQGSNDDEECFCLRILFPPIIWCCLESIGAYIKDLWESIFPPPPLPPSRPASLSRLSPTQRKTLTKTMTGTMHQIKYPCIVMCGLKVLAPNGQQVKEFEQPAYDPIYTARICRYYSQLDTEQFAKQVEEFSNQIEITPLAPESIVQISQLILSHDPESPETFDYVVENLTLRGGHLTEDKAQAPEKARRKGQTFHKGDIEIVFAGAPGLYQQVKFDDLFHKKNEVFRLRNTSLETDVMIWSKAPEQPTERFTIIVTDTSRPEGSSALPESKRGAT